MFEAEVVDETSVGVGVGDPAAGDLPLDGLAGWAEQQWVLASLTEADAPPEPALSVAERDPSGWSALDLDMDTASLAGLSDSELIDAAVGWERIAAWAAARQVRVVAEFGRRRPGDDPQAIMCRDVCAGSEWAPDELGMALRLSRGAAMVRLNQAARFVEVLPATLQMWERGLVDGAKARAICDATAILEPALAVAVQERVLARAPDMTLAQLRAALARALIAVDPRGAAERHREARAQRRVRLTERDDGMASLWALLSAPDAVASYELLSRLARSLGADDPRDIDARRADLLVDLLTGRLELLDTEQPPDSETTDSDTPTGETPGDAAGSDSTGSDSTGSGAAERAPTSGGQVPGDPAGGGHPVGEIVPVVGRGAGRARAPAAGPVNRAAGRPLVHVVMPYSTLIGADDEPCELAGYGPIPAELAREIAADGVWKRLVTDPLSGALLDHGRTTYRPPVALAEFVRARDVRCRSPICRRQAQNCELDHAIAWAEGGTTAENNLWAGCVHDHHLKHQPGWTVWLLRDGLVEWITPTGHHYITDPHDYRPIDDPDPPLLRRPTGMHPVTEQLHESDATSGSAPKRGKQGKRGRASEAVRRLGSDAMFGRTGDTTWSPPDPDGEPPF